MTNLNDVIKSLAKIMTYPTSEIREAVNECEENLSEFSNDLSSSLGGFKEHCENRPLSDLEEFYTATFDLSPKTFPYAAYHIYGEEYKRGLLMAGLKSSYAKYGIDIKNELPDYLPLLLNLYTKLDDPEKAESLRDELILPGLSKMQEELEKSNNVYAGLIGIIAQVLKKTKE